MTELDAEVVIVGLGGNVGGDPAILARFAAVVQALEAWSTVRASRVYRTGAQGPAQADFLNAALAVAAPDGLKASELIREVMAIERTLGRNRALEVRWGPRPLDLDVLLWGPRQLAYAGPPALVVPHPRLAERGFALQPVIDLVGAALRHPSDGRSLGALLATVADQRVELTGYAIAGAVAAVPALDPSAAPSMDPSAS